MDPTKPPTPGFLGGMKIPLLPQQVLGRGQNPEKLVAGRGTGQPLTTGDTGVGRGFITPGVASPMQFGRGVAMLPTGAPMVGFASMGQPLTTGDTGIGRGFITPGVASPMQFGRGVAMLPTRAPMVGFARGLPMTPDQLGFSLARGLPFSVAEPKVGTAAEPPSRPFLDPQTGNGQLSEPVMLGGAVKNTENVFQAEVTARKFDTPSHGSPLVSMFRGMGLEPSKALWGRGALPVGRMAAGDATTELKLQPGPAGMHATPGRDEKTQDNSSSISSHLGRGLPTHTLMLGVGRTAMPHLDLGRGLCAAPSLPQGLQSPAVSSTLSLPTTPHPSPSAGAVQSPSPQPSPGLAISPPPKGPLTMEETRETLSKMGTKGQPLTIGSNHISISCNNEAVYQYHVTFAPNVESMGMRFAMMKDHRPTTGEVVAFDGSILFLPIKMKDVVLKSERRTDNQEIEIKIQMTKILPPHSDLCLPFYNVVLRRIMKMVGLKLVGRNHYIPESAVILGKHRLQIWPGYSTCIKRTDGGLFLMVDVLHKVLRNDSVLTAMNMMYQQGTESFQDECAKELVGRIVITRYNNRTYRVDDIEWGKSPKDTFTLTDGSNTSFVDYYRKNYGITIKELDQPLLVHRPKERSRPGGKQIITGEILLVPELSFMTGITDKMRKDFHAMRELTMHINLGSDQHSSAINNLLHKIKNTPETMMELEKWGLEISNKVIIIEGRTLPLETIRLQSASAVPSNDMSWSRELVRDASISCVPLRVWAIFYPRRCAEQINELVAIFQKVAGPIGMHLERPIKIELRDDRTETYMKSIHSQLTSEPSMQMVVCIITGNRDDLYAAIKKMCCVKNPVPSQVINARTISRPQKLKSVAQKILLQMNCKVGGELWTVNVPLKHLMVIGVDIHHDASQRNRSVMGFVASLNSLMTQWYSRVAFQSRHEEIIDGFQVCLLAALQKYYEVNHNLPEKIVVYRDGVSDSQLNVVAAHEVPQLLKSFRTFPSFEPKLVYIVVQKRISTTLYALAGNGGLVTPPPGTVLDHTLTQRDWVDFYLMAHYIRQGCGFPTRYVSVYNTANLPPDHLQRLTYKMCHLYWNWPGAIRVPAPCKYAHKLAYLSGQYLHAEPAVELSDRLFFL